MFYRNVFGLITIAIWGFLMNKITLVVVSDVMIHPTPYSVMIGIFMLAGLIAGVIFMAMSIMFFLDMSKNDSTDEGLEKFLAALYFLILGLAGVYPAYRLIFS
jgi:hypothetical protein